MLKSWKISSVPENIHLQVIWSPAFIFGQVRDSSSSNNDSFWTGKGKNNKLHYILKEIHQFIV